MRFHGTRIDRVVSTRASDEESYSYRIGMIHKRRDVAYANAGVRSGALSTDLFQYSTSLGLHLICERASALSAPSGCVAEIAFLQLHCMPGSRTELAVATWSWSGQNHVTWLILPVVICLSQRLSHACLSISFYTVKLRMAH